MPAAAVDSGGTGGAGGLGGAWNAQINFDQQDLDGPQAPDSAQAKPAAYSAPVDGVDEPSKPERVSHPHACEQDGVDSANTRDRVDAKPWEDFQLLIQLADCPSCGRPVTQCICAILQLLQPQQ